MIYHLALTVENYPFEISEHKPSQRALLQTCKQIRDEASPIFYHGTPWFTIYVDCQVVEPQGNHWIWKHVSKDSTSFITF